MCMPQSMITEWIWTGSLMAWTRFVQLRGDQHAQAECWPYANLVQEQLERLFPISTRELLEITY
jgi:thymidylate synthase (FAD)